jgi:hypothetical protein
LGIFGLEPNLDEQTFIIFTARFDGIVWYNEIRRIPGLVFELFSRHSSTNGGFFLSVGAGILSTAVIVTEKQSIAV